MKKKLFTIILLISALSFGQNKICFEVKPFESLGLDKKEIKKYEIKKDNFKELTYIKPSSVAGSILYPYLVVDNNNIGCLRLVTQYNDTNWLNVQKMIFILDGEKFEYDFLNVTKDVDRFARVNEKSDIEVDKYLHDFLIKYTDIKNREELRYSGSSHVKDIKDILPKTKERIIDMMILFEKIKK